MTRDEASAPVRALRPLGAAPESKGTAPEALSVQLPEATVQVRVQASRAESGVRAESVVLLEPASEGASGLMPEALMQANVLAPAIADLGWPLPEGDEGDQESASVGRLVALLDHFDIERAVIVGNDVGAELAVAVASGFPERIGGLVLINGGLGTGDPAATRDALVGLRMPVALIYGGAVGEARGYTRSAVRATTSWLRHIDVRHLAAEDPEHFDQHAIATVTTIVEAHAAAARARAAHPATGSHRVISPTDEA